MSFKAVNPVDTTKVEIAPAPGASFRNKVLKVYGSNDHATNAVAVIFYQGTTEIDRVFLAANGGSFVWQGDQRHPWWDPSVFPANANFQVALSGAGSCRISAEWTTERAVNITN